MTVNTNLVLHERANGVILNNRFYPYKTQLFDTTGQSLTPRPNTRLFVKDVFVSVTNVGIQAIRSINLLSTLNGQSRNVLICHCPAMTQATDIWGFMANTPVNILFDREAPLTHTQNSTSAYIMVRYAEIDDV